MNKYKCHNGYNCQNTVGFNGLFPFFKGTFFYINTAHTFMYFFLTKEKSAILALFCIIEKRGYLTIETCSTILILLILTLLTMYLCFQLPAMSVTITIISS